MFRHLLFALCLVCSFARAESSAELERILAECGSLTVFLGDTAHQTRYYNALREWIKVDETQFPRETFNLFINETKRLVAQHPDLEQRLWGSEGLGKSFVVKIPEIAPPEKFVAAGWQTFLGDWRKTLREKAARVKTRQEAETVLAGLDAEAAKFATGGERAARVGLAKVLDGVRTDPERARIEGAVAFLILDELAKGRGARLDAGVVADVKDLFAKLSGTDLSPGARLVARDMLPKVDSLRTQIGLAIDGPERQSAREIRFDPLPRRFHGIWKGIKYNECVGGGCGWNADLTARRFLTVALNGTEMHELTERGNHLGFTHHAPIVRNSDKAVFGSAEFISPLFGQTFSVERDGKVFPIPFTELWFDAYDAAKPATWKGVVKSRSLNIHNAGVLPAVMSSPVHRYGPSAGIAETEFTHGDVSFARWLVDNTRVTERVKSIIGGDVVYDAAISGAAGLRVFTRFDARELSDTGRMREVWAKLSPQDRADRLVSWLQHAEHRPDVRDFLRERARDVSHALLKEALAKQCEAGMIDGTRNLDLLPLTADEIVTALTSGSEWNIIKRNMGQSAVALVDTLVAKRASAQTLDQLIRVINHDPSIEQLARTPGIKALLHAPAGSKQAAWLKGIAARFAARKPGSAGELANLLVRPEKHDTVESKAMGKFLGDHLEDFLRAGPDAYAYLKFREAATGLEIGIQLREKTMQIAAAHDWLGPRTPGEFFEWMKAEIDSPADAYVKRIGEFHAAQAEWFAKLSPTPAQIQNFLRRLPATIDAGLKAREVILANHPSGVTAEGFLALVRLMRQSELTSPTQGYLDKLHAFANDKIDKFLALNPNIDQVVGMLKELSLVETCMALRTKYLAQRNPQNLSDLVAVLKKLGEMEHASPSEDYRTAVRNFGAGHLDRILATKPPPERYEEVFSLIPDASARQSLRNRLVIAATPDEVERYFAALPSDEQRARVHAELLAVILEAEPTAAQLKQYHERFKTPEARAQVREQLIALAERRFKPASPARIIAWLDLDRAAGDKIDPLPKRVRQIVEPGRWAQTWAAVLCPFRKLLGH